MSDFSQRNFEVKWASWAMAQLAMDSKLKRCEICEHSENSPFDRVLWPGYLGKRYADARVLIVGAVHNAGQLRTQEMQALAAYAERWALAGNASQPDEYLRLVREAYLASATREWIRPNQVWGLLDEIVKRLHLSWEQVAFTNWSKCKSMTYDAPGATRAERRKEQDRQYLAHVGSFRRIQDRLPVDQLQPNAIFVCCGLRSVVNEVRAAPLDVPIIRVFDQPRATNGFAPPSKFPTAQYYPGWLNDDAALFKELVS